jgi:hypothetical protein
MTRSAPAGSPSRRWTVRAVALGSILTLLLGACGGGTVDGGGGGGGGGANSAAYDQVIQQTQAALGNAMLSATVEDGPTLKVTLDDIAGKGMAKLFLCSSIKGFLKTAGLQSTKVVMVTKSGTQLATDADCPG